MSVSSGLGITIKEARIIVSQCMVQGPFGCVLTQERTPTYMQFDAPSPLYMSDLATTFWKMESLR